MGNYLCPEFVLKCNKSVHLPTWLCLLGELFRGERRMCTGYGNLIWFRLSSPRDLKRVSEHFYCISVQIRGIHNFSYILIMFAIRLGYLWYILQNGQKQEFIILWSLASVARNSTHEFFFSRFRCHLYARAVSNDCKKPVCFSSSISKVIWWNKRECLTVRRRIFLYVNTGCLTRLTSGYF